MSKSTDRLAVEGTCVQTVHALISRLFLTEAPTLVCDSIITILMAPVTLTTMSMHRKRTVG